MKIKLILLGLGALAIVTTIGLGYRHYQAKLAEIEVLTANNATLTVAVETQQVTIDAAQQTIADWQEALRLVEERNRQLEAIASEARAEQERLNEMFSELDIEGLAADDPASLAADINARTDYLNCLLERATGAGGADCSDGTGSTP